MVLARLGGQLLSLTDIESGLLRRNATAPYHISPPFAPQDRRVDWILPTLDQRFHFALNCGVRLSTMSTRYRPMTRARVRACACVCVRTCMRALYM